MNEQHISMPHKLILNERKTLTLTGVREALSFDEENVLLQTELGLLCIQGQELKLKNLSPEGGQVSVEGTICALIYEQPRQNRGWLGRLLR